MNIFEFWNESSEFPLYLMGKFALLYKCLDYEHVSRTNYARKPRYYYISKHIWIFIMVLKWNVKEKFSLCLNNYAPNHERVLGSGCIGPPFLTSALDRG
jgi:hypothetical protein